MASWERSGLLEPSDDVGHQTERASQGNEEGDGHRGSATGAIINAAGPAWRLGLPSQAETMQGSDAQQEIAC
jgi:hypothetical protein